MRQLENKKAAQWRLKRKSMATAAHLAGLLSIQPLKSGIAMLFYSYVYIIAVMSTPYQLAGELIGFLTIPNETQSQILLALPYRPLVPVAYQFLSI